MRTLTSAAICCLLLSAAARGGESPWMPGGEEVRKKVAARQGRTELSKLAASMKPGAWAELKTEIPKGLWSAPSRKGLHIGTWSDDAHWDSRTGQFVYFGVRQARKLVAYSEEKNQWRNIPFAGKKDAPELAQKFGHQYSCNSLDPERSLYYTYTWCYDIVKDEWSKLPPASAKLGSTSMCWEYFSAMDTLLSVGRKPKSGSLYGYGFKEKTWRGFERIPVHGYHSMARHNPIRKEVMFAGGNDCGHVVVILDAEGKTRRMKDCPVDLNVNHDIVTVDPVSGRYLIMGTREKQLIEFDSEKNEYRLADDFKKTPYPFGRYSAPMVAFIPEYGVTMWADRKVQLYKHDASAQLKVIEAPAPAPKEGAK
ncbi:MAG: hypothetical protein ACYTGB_07545 [Planctomycetota bacterium]